MLKQVQIPPVYGEFIWPGEKRGGEIKNKKKVKVIVYLHSGSGFVREQQLLLEEAEQDEAWKG